ncbi:MAG TPA: ABC transporter substrate-binding protein [Candidatus Limnocylindrales bacterium]
MRPFRRMSLLVVAILATGCTGSPAATSSAPSVAPSTAPASASVAASPSAGASASPAVSATPSPCTPDQLSTVAAGTLTVGADNPAFPPYYEPNDDGSKTKPWELGQPTNGKGLESATAYAVATKLGYTNDTVAWKAVAFNNAIAPGPKPFDIYLTQVSYSAKRAKVVDLSDGYFDLNQAVVALKSNPIAQVTDVAGLKAFTLGTQAGTTSYTYITDTIQPSKQPRAYDSLDAAVTALKAKQIDGIVADLPTTFYMRDAQLKDAVIVGSLPTVGDVEHFSILLAKNSGLTACVNEAIGAIKSDGTLAGIVQQWITSQGAPELK